MPQKKRNVRKQQEKRIRLRVAASLMDFGGVVGSIVLIILCALLLQSLLMWLRGDFEETFRTIRTIILNSVVVTGN